MTYEHAVRAFLVMALPLVWPVAFRASLELSHLSDGLDA